MSDDNKQLTVAELLARAAARPSETPPPPSPQLCGGRHSAAELIDHPLARPAE